MTRYRLLLEWDGRPFMGWQRQAHGPSVQGALEDALLRLFGEVATVHAAGRTDAGVHAAAMAAHVDLARPLTPFRLSEALNFALRPQPVAVLEAAEAAPDWHARFSCVGRSYRYVIENRRAPLTRQQGFAWRVSAPLDEQAMAEAARLLVGRHDFTTFRSVQCQAESPVKTLDRLDVRRDGTRVEVTAEARSFLHHQVRSMVGCLALVGRGTWTVENLGKALEARTRGALGHNAPPDGLYFTGAGYPSP